jgi:hypothetical protein
VNGYRGVALLLGAAALFAFFALGYGFGRAACALCPGG